MLDLVIANAKLFFPLGYERPLLDIGIRNGKIVRVEQGLKGASTIDLKGKMVFPGLVETHLHLDTAYTAEDNNSGFKCSYEEEKSSLERRFRDLSEDAITEDIYSRGERLLNNCVKQGTTAVRAQLNFTGNWGENSLTAYEMLKKRFVGILDMQNTVPYWPESSDQWHKAAKKGRIDSIGGYPGLRKGGPKSWYKAIDELIGLAVEYDIPLDLHFNETAENPLSCARYLVDYILSKKDFTLYNKVTCSHFTATEAPGISNDAVIDIISRFAKANINVVALTSNDMVTVGTPDRRGTTSVRKFLDAGANVCLASGNIRDTIHPFGNCDLLSEALTAAQIHKLGTRRELRRLLELITFNAAKALNIENYGVLPGCTADLTVLDADTPEDALISQAKRLLVLKKGEKVAGELELKGATNHD